MLILNILPSSLGTFTSILLSIFASSEVVEYLKLRLRNMKKIGYILSAVLLFVGVLMAQTKGAVISSPATEFDFGTIKEANGKVSHTFIIHNAGDAPLVITRVATPCACTTPEYSREPIAPGKEGKITVTYNPAGRPGPFYKNIAIYSNGRDGAFTIRIKGTVE